MPSIQTHTSFALKVILVVMALWIAGAGLPAFAQESSAVRCVITPLNQAVNIRETPGTDAPIVGQLNPAQEVVALSAQTVNTMLWYRTESGWIAAPVVTGQNCPDAVFNVTIASGAYDVLIPPEMLEAISNGTIDGVALPAVVSPTESACVTVRVIDGEVVCLFPIADNIRCIQTAEFEGQSYCVRPMTRTTPPDAGAVPDEDCDRYMVYEGAVICIINTISDLGFPVPTDPLGAEPLEVQRPPLMMFVNPPGDACTDDVFSSGFGMAGETGALMTNALIPVDQTLQDETSRLQVVLVIQEQVLPLGANNPCEVEILVLTPGADLQKSDNSAIIARMDAVRIAPPLIPQGGESESGAWCFADDGVMGCAIDFGVSVVTTWYTPARGTEYQVCTLLADGQTVCQ